MGFLWFLLSCDCAQRHDHVTPFSGKFADFVPTYAVIATVSQTPYSILDYIST